MEAKYQGQWYLKFSSITWNRQGCALTAPGCLRRLTFSFRWVKKFPVARPGTLATLIHFLKFIFNFSITGNKHSFPLFDPDIFMKITWVCWNLYFSLFQTWTILFGSIAHVSRFKSEWHENFNGFHRTTWGFLSHPKARITEFCDQQAVKWVCIQNTSSSDVLWRPTLRSGFLR